MKTWKLASLLTGILAAAAGLSALALRPGRVPPVTDADGRPVAGSLAAWEPVEAGGVRQWLAIRGRNPANPLLLFVHGGPGDPETALLFHYNKDLCDRFTVVSWEQRGAGRSFSPGIPPESMTLERFMEDTHEVTQYLKRRFQTERIYLAGHSWGSLVGILTVARHPQDYIAYIGVSQAVLQAESERIGYDWALQTAKARNNRKAIAELERIGPPSNGIYGCCRKPGRPAIDTAGQPSYHYFFYGPRIFGCSLPRWPPPGGNGGSNGAPSRSAHPPANLLAGTRG